MKCIVCGTEHNQEYCPNCGAKADIGVDKRYCPSCGTPCDTAFCPICGQATVKREGEGGKRCPVCGTYYETPYCPNCGQRAASQTAASQQAAKGKKCPRCGSFYETRYCPNCGFSEEKGDEKPPVFVVENESRPAAENSGGQTKVVSSYNRWIAFFLCAFLGYLGVHRFYVGKIGSGLVYMFTGGLFGFGWILDLIMIFIGSFADKDDRPLV